MCGIAGILTRRPRPPEALRRTSEAMAATLAHRGPDSAGYWSDGRASLVHRRLAVIDLATGGQPMIGTNGQIIVFNGEIYNFREIRSDLIALGWRFVGESDTEVLLNAYRQWGESCLGRLVGMFAFAIWEPEARRLFIARDRVGKKPLFYWKDGDTFAFASEIKALLALPEVHDAASIDPRAISDFLSLGYILAPKTAFRGIRQVPPAHAGHYDWDKGELSFREYWPIHEKFLKPRRAYDPAAREEFSSLFADAVSLRLRSDVPLGVYLSGGLDSSAVLAAVCERTGGKVRAYGVKFAEAGYDESAYAELAAARLGVPLELLPQPAFSSEQLGKLVWQVDEPFADTSMMPTYILNQTARNRITVALGGDGADELLAGYSTHRADVFYRIYRRIPESMQRLARAASGLIPPNYRKVSLNYRLRQFLGAVGMTPERAHYWWRVVFSDAEKKRLIGPDLAAELAEYDPFADFQAAYDRVRGVDFLDRSLYADLKTWLASDILVKADRMSMAHGLELRSPFLDHRLIEFTATLAPEAKMDGRRQKAILRDIMADRLPTEILTRAKQGFGAPTRSVGHLTLKTIDFSGQFQQDFRLDPDREDVTYKSFALAVLKIWLDMFAHYKKTGIWEPPT